MKRDLVNNVIPEYVSVLRRAGEEGWLAPLVEAHATTCTFITAGAIMRVLPDIPEYLRSGPQLRFWKGEHRGRARYNRGTGLYGMALPITSGTRCCQLRIGLVLHEAAHIWDHQQTQKFGHGPSFCRALRKALTFPWREVLHMPTSNYQEIYARHRGPFSLLITRETQKKSQPIQGSEKIKGPFNAEEAHEEARMLVNDPRENIVQVHVFSDGEGQFCGAFYKRGEEYNTWEEETENAGRMELPEQLAAPALLQGRSESLSTMVAAEHDGLPDEPVQETGGDRPVRDVPTEEPAKPKRARAPQPDKPAKLPGDRFPAVRGKALELGKEDGWPPSAAAQRVRAFYTGGTGVRATSAELVAALGAELQGMGVAFPASLISRLKQAGFLKEVA